MSKRLQVLLPDQDMAAIERAARQQHLSVGEWVRRTLREARQSQAEGDPVAKLHSIRQAAAHAFPTADIEQMLGEIERGYQS